MRSPLALIASLVLAAGAHTAGAVTRASKCQETIAVAGRRLFGGALAVLATCDRAGTRDPRTDCGAAAAPSRRLDTMAVAPLRLVRHSCSDPEVASLAPGGDCRGVLTVKDLAACLRASHEDEAERLLAVSSGVRRAPGRGMRRCALVAFRQGRHLALRRLRLLQRCKRRPESFDVIPGEACGSAPSMARATERWRARATERIAVACRAWDPGRDAFGAPCDVAGTLHEAAGCVLAATAAASDGALAAEYPEPGFCGDAGEAVERRIDDLLARMTLDEKLRQMHGDGLVDGAWRTPGAERLHIPGLAMLDGPRGAGLLGGRATSFPVPMARGATWDPGLEARVGEAIGDEVRAKGASMVLAPTLNLLRHPRWGRAQETYGEDTLHLGRMGVGFILGAQRHVIATAKHFALNSIEETRLVADVSVDERSLREVYLPHFRMAVQDGHVGAVMAAYNRVNHHYCAENVHLLREVLRGDWGFRGLVESDWFIGTRSTGLSAVAGLDIEMPVPVYYGDPLAAAVEGGEVPLQVIDDAVRHILRVTLCFRLDSDPPVPDPAPIQSPAHLDVALEAAREGIVLLRNERGALPLDRETLSSIAVVGDLADRASLGDLGSSVVTPSFAVSPLDGIRELAGAVTVTHVPGPPLSASDREIVAAADAAVVVAGLGPEDEGEGTDKTGDRISLGLPAEQEELVAAVSALNPRTIVVVEAGSSVTMPWVNRVAAVLMAWYPGQLGGQAIAEVLFGDVDPSGRLPVTFPRAERDLPPFDNTHIGVRYGYLHGYRWLDRHRTQPLFPLGFGLSYTTFRYSNLALSRTTVSPLGRLRVSADVTNTGGVPGDEVVQLYVSYRGSLVDRADRDLKSFARVHLEPGETRTVELGLRAADLAYWDVASGGWRIEPIRYRVQVGPSSRNLPLVGSFTIAEH